MYGFARSGRDFITSFARWFADHEQVAHGLRSFGVTCLRHDGDDAGAIKRATQAREYVVFEERAGRNVLVRSNTICCERPSTSAEILWCCARSLGLYLFVSWSSSHSERSHREDLRRRCETWFWSDSCVHHCWTVFRHTAQNNSAVLVAPVTLHTFRSFFRCRTACKIRHTLVRVGSKGN